MLIIANAVLAHQQTRVWRVTFIDIVAETLDANYRDIKTKF